MRRLALAGVVAACGNDPGLLLDVHTSGGDVASVEVFLSDGSAGNAMGLPPGGASAPAKVPGTVYTVIDRVAATAHGGTATILLQRGDRSDVPALLVLGYNANHEPVAEAVIESDLALPASQTVELKVTLDPATFGFSGTGRHVARWSSTQPMGDPNGPCIGVLGGGGAGNAFFSVAGDLDCDAEKPDCDDTSYKYVGGAAPQNAQCVSDALYPQTMQACTLGATIACTDGIGTCGPRTASGATEVPICVPDTLCKHCSNSNSTTGTSGIDTACETAARGDQDTIRFDCKVLATPGQTSNTVSPCIGTPSVVDMTGLVGAGWGCAGAPMYFFPSYGVVAPTSFLPIGGTPTSPDYRVDAHCGGGPIAFSFLGAANSTFPDEPNTDVLALFTFPMHSPTQTGPVTQLAIPFRLSYEVTGGCPPGDQPAMTCVVTSPSGNPADDPLWKGCAGAP